MSNYFRLQNNNILITGGTSGIGFELVKRFYELDNRIIVSSSSKTNLEKLKLEFPNITTIVCNLSDFISVQNLITRCLNEHGDINIVINNAGIQYNYTWTEEPDGFKKIIMETNVNFISPMLLCYGLLPILTEKESSAIINVSSGLAFAPKMQAPVYCATKAAVHNATKALRYQLENTEVKVFEIIPPLVDTAMTKGRGKGKISPEALVDEFLQDFKSTKFESNIGKVKMLRFIQRVSPKLADRIMKGA